MTLTLPTSEPNGLNIEAFDTTTFLAHASAQARARGLQDIFVVDVDSHHSENSSFREIVEYLEDPVLRQHAQAGMTRAGGGVTSLMKSEIVRQDMGGRITRSYTASMEKTPGTEPRDATLCRRYMDAMGTDIAMLFPTPMLGLGTHPVVDIEIKWARAYNRWLVERVLSAEPRIRSMLYLPFNDAPACEKMIEDFGDKPGVSGFMITASHRQAVHDNKFMRTYRMLEERSLPLAFHGIYNWEDGAFRTMNRFISVHALGFVFYNMMHCVNWIVNGLPERFPNLKLIWMESGLAWVPFVMQRLDNEYLMRSNEAPALKKMPSDYMRDMYYTNQPMEHTDLKAMQVTFEMINAKTQLLYSSDYPHWDFDLPSVIWDLPFLDHAARVNILGENARRVFNLQGIGKLAKIPAA